MGSLSISTMREYLSRSISGTVNQNKVNGMMAEFALRSRLHDLGFGDRVSPGGWIFRSVRHRSSEEDLYAQSHIVCFPEIVRPDIDYAKTRSYPEPTQALHSISSIFHGIGILSFHCAAIIDIENDPTSVRWYARQLGNPEPSLYEPFPENIVGFIKRPKPYNFLRYKQNVSSIPDGLIVDEFSLENLRIAFADAYLSQGSDVDSVIWGSNRPYPVEIKEKTVANDNKVGPYFGLDIGPFVKLAFFAAKQGNMASLFIVKEIDSVQSRNTIGWWVTDFETIAKVASWIGRGGGTSMGGGRSTTVQVPKSAFSELDVSYLRAL